MNLVRGMHDILPPRSGIFTHIIDQASSVSKLYGYNEIATPIMEYTNVFSRSLGDSSDIVMKEMYTFQDKSEKMVTLRPEGTAGIVRALLSSGTVNDLPKKYYYHGPMFRYERPQRGRYRQFHQFGVEYIGCSDYNADVEVLDLACTFLDRLQMLNKCKLNINTLGDDESRLNYSKKLKEYYETCKFTMSNDSKNRFERGAILRILDSKDEIDIEINKNAPLFSDSLTLSAASRFEHVLIGLSKLGINYEINQKLVRGLDYYSHTAFEFVSNDILSQGATLLAGGRYDKLFQQMGGVDVQAIGWAAGLERLELQFDSTLLAKEQRVVVLIPIITEEDQKDGNDNTIMQKTMLLAQDLRHRNIAIQVILDKGKLKKLMKVAFNRYNPNILILLGRNEVQENHAQIKDLDAKSSTTVAFNAVTNTVQNLL